MYPVKENSEATQPLEMLLITKEECEDILALGLYIGEERKMLHGNIRWLSNLAAGLAFVLGAESVVLLLVKYGLVVL